MRNLLTASLFAACPLAQLPPQWQVNSPACSLTVDGLTNHELVGPIRAGFLANSTHALQIQGLPGHFCWLVLAGVPAQPRLSVTAGGQIQNVAFPHPSNLVAGLGALPPGGLTLSVGYPPGFYATVQAVLFDPSHPDLFRLSAAVELRTGPADAYVDGDSTVAFEDGSMTFPFHTLGAAMTASIQGQVVHVDHAANDYHEIVGIDRNNLHLIGDNWNQPNQPRPAVHPPTTSPGYTVNVWENTQGAIIEQLTVDAGVYDGSRYPAPAWGLCVNLWNGAGNCAVRNCWITGSNVAARDGTWGIGLEGGNTNIDIAHCTFSDLDHVYAPDPKNIGPVYMSGSQQVSVRNCDFTHIGELFTGNNGVSYLQMIYVVDSTDVVISNNLVHDLLFVSLGSPYSTETDSRFLTVLGASNRITVTNNTVVKVDMSRVQGQLLRQFFAANLDLPGNATATVSNNICSHVTFVGGSFTSTIGLMGPNPAAFTAGWCCFDGTYQLPFAPSSLQGPGCLLVDPQYVSVAAGDYHLTTSSPCVFGDPAILDPGGGRSQMGCYGGPRGHLPIGIY